MGAWRVVLLAGAAGALLTVAVVEDPAIHFAYQNSDLHVILETAVALVGALVALLVYGRFRATRLLSELLVAYAVALLSCASLLFTAIPRALWGAEAERFASWGPIIVRGVAAVILAVAAFAPARRIAPRHLRLLAVVAALLPAAVAAVVASLGSNLPAAITVAAAPDSSTRPVITAQGGVFVVQVVVGVLFLVAGIAFARRGAVEGDSFSAWFGAGCLLAAAARADFALYPSLYSDWFYIGDVLRLASYACWLVGGVKEIFAYWQDRQDHAVDEERRRLARDLHDGMAQELAFVATQSRWLARRNGDPKLNDIATAAERALDESRRAIMAISGAADESLEEAVARTAEDLAGRTGLKLKLNLQEGVEVARHEREHLLRILREALTNAVRHGGAQRVTISLAGESSPYLRITDDGSGFDPGDALSASGFGLRSMRERAAALGATLRVESSPGAGATVEVAWETNDRSGSSSPTITR